MVRMPKAINTSISVKPPSLSLATDIARGYLKTGPTLLKALAEFKTFTILFKSVFSSLAIISPLPRKSSTKRPRNIKEILASEASLQTDKSMNWVSLTLRFGNQTKIQRSRHPGMDTSFPRRRERDPAPWMVP
uniref:Uncharacterized protein n=1 Tax=Candidatus Kentrum sp. UNK TaxID=2126344 RepID=A0A451ARL9_9GAMM|nr:MAG: hypothetical protein BECKUNK1418G_GA0071005_12601 [Candidatus Kentron sp. UNK]VFK73671.1 MAG: hypothetical protein BECKUNK1418H_GA0071006_12471 [Candidatus Kentron sp. UNK]